MKHIILVIGAVFVLNLIGCSSSVSDESNTKEASSIQSGCIVRVEKDAGGVSLLQGDDLESAMSCETRDAIKNALDGATALLGLGTFSCVVFPEFALSKISGLVLAGTGATTATISWAVSNMDCDNSQYYQDINDTVCRQLELAGVPCINRVLGVWENTESPKAASATEVVVYNLKTVEMLYIPPYEQAPMGIGLVTMKSESCVYSDTQGSVCNGSMEIATFFDVKNPNRIKSAQFDGKFQVVRQDSQDQALLTLSVLPPFDSDPPMKELFRGQKVLKKVRR